MRWIERNYDFHKDFNQLAPLDSNHHGLVVVHIIDVERVGIGKTGSHPPVCTNRYRPRAFQFAFERMQSETGHIDRATHPELSGVT